MSLSPVFCIDDIHFPFLYFVFFVFHSLFSVFFFLILIPTVTPSVTFVDDASGKELKVPVVDAFSMCKGSDWKELLSDGLHLSASGNRWLYDQVKIVFHGNTMCSLVLIDPMKYIHMLCSS